jgi:hypothetical protein
VRNRAVADVLAQFNGRRRHRQSGRLVDFDDGTGVQLNACRLRQGTSTARSVDKRSGADVTIAP